MVICSVSSPSKAPTCEAVKNTYLATVPNPPGRILAQVSVQGSNKPVCQTIYEPDGTFVRDYKPAR